MFTRGSGVMRDLMLNCDGAVYVGGGRPGLSLALSALESAGEIWFAMVLYDKER